MCIRDRDRILINPYCPEESKKERLEKIIRHSVGEHSFEMLTTAEEVEKADLRNRRILFTVSLGQSVINLSLSLIHI